MTATAGGLLQLVQRQLSRRQWTLALVAAAAYSLANLLVSVGDEWIGLDYVDVADGNRTLLVPMKYYLPPSEAKERSALRFSYK